MLRPIALAFAFFTVIPVRVSGTPRPEDWGRSMLAAPLVGLVIGIVLLGLAHLLAGGPEGPIAAILLIVWVGLTGALHLDGLADFADAWVGGHGDRERTLQILKDPRSGPVAVTAVGLLLIGKFAALEALIASQSFAALIMVPVLGRAAVLAIMLRLPYVRPAGIGEAHARHLPRMGALSVLVLCALGILGISGLVGFAALFVAIVISLALERSMRHRLGGCTGDGLGGACEIVEAAVLIAVALSDP